MSLSVFVSIFALIISCIALYFTFKKDAHRIRLDLGKNSPEFTEFLSINNDSSFPVQIASIGHLAMDREIEWMSEICDASVNVTFKFPIKVDARSTYHAVVLWEYLKRAKKYAYCVQLVCGRTFVISNTLPRKFYIKLKMMSLISWSTSGRVGFEKNNIHIKKYL
jgi:hypothetical protein